MEGTDVAIADPIAALDDHDDRPSVKDLIEENREHIDKIKAEIAEDSHYNPTKHDDLWLLRFLLSHKKKLTPSVKAARTTLAFRHEHRLDAEDLRDYPMDRTTVKCPPGSIILEDLKAFMRNVAENLITYGIPDPRRGVVGYLCLGGVDQNLLVEHLDEKAWLGAMCFLSEWTHQWLDYITRTTGRLTKTVRLLDTEFYKISNFSREGSRRDGVVANQMEDCYPQLLEKIFLCNPPVWAQVPWRVMRPFLPKRVVTKIDFISPRRNQKEKKRLSDMFRRRTLRHVSAAK
jgi:hypothetical protein